MTNSEKFAQENGFQLKLGRWNFIYTEGQKKITIPVEMLMNWEYLWEISKESITSWDAPYDKEIIDPITASRILQHIDRFIELTEKKVLIVGQEKDPLQK